LFIFSDVLKMNDVSLYFLSRRITDLILSIQPTAIVVQISGHLGNCWNMSASFIILTEI